MLATLLTLSLLAGTIARDCSKTRSDSEDPCEPDVDPCCVAIPAGISVFRQRFEPDVGGDMGSWGIDGLDVLDCSTESPATYEPCSPTYTHEEIGSFCHRSKLFGDKSVTIAEGEWAQSEVGEGVEELWERAWNTAGRYMSTVSPLGVEATYSEGDHVAAFFQTLHNLHGRFPTSTILADHDIIPSEDVTYALSELVDALSFDELKPIVTCDNMTLSSVSWPIYLAGLHQLGEFTPAGLDRRSNCPTDGIIYPISTASLPATTTSHTWDEIYRPTPRAITKSHDESRIAPDSRAQPVPKKQLGFFKGSDQEKEGRKEGKVEKQYWRDEL